MKWLAVPLGVVALSLVGWGPASARQNSPATGQSDIYHVHFTKAAPGQAAALGKALLAPDPTAPMPDHFVVLRHQEGDDWDYVVIQHVGSKASLEAAATAPNPGRDLRAWHDDTFVTGPTWAEFTGAMGAAGAIYTVGVQRAVPGHRDQLQAALTQPAPASAKIQTGSVFMQHREGADWTFLTITRYNSWQDFAADRAGASADPGGAGGWADIRQHSAFHRDTIADRIK